MNLCYGVISIQNTTQPYSNFPLLRGFVYYKFFIYLKYQSVSNAHVSSMQLSRHILYGSSITSWFSSRTIQESQWCLPKWMIKNSEGSIFWPSICGSWVAGSLVAAMLLQHLSIFGKVTAPLCLRILNYKWHSWIDDLPVICLDRCFLTLNIKTVYTSEAIAEPVWKSHLHWFKSD